MEDCLPAGCNFSHTSRICARSWHRVGRAVQFAESERKPNGEGEAPRRVLSSSSKKEARGQQVLSCCSGLFSLAAFVASSITSLERVLLYWH
jgi:hypothetical protein